MVKVSMIGAGSGFVLHVAKEMVANPRVFKDSVLVMMDINPERLRAAEREVKKILHDSSIKLKTTTEQKAALDGADYVVTSCEIKRWELWLKDQKIPERYGVHQLKSENGGPAGQIHALRNIGIFMQIASAMECYCPHAWLMNFSNPMSFICTYLNRYTKIRTLGFCHQVHGSFGLIAEVLGMEPGELEVITAGINHFNWLLDIRRRGTGKSCMKEFFELVRNSDYWKKKFDKVPRQEFTLEILNTFGTYPVGYDDHIVEYLPFFYERDEWEKYGCESCENEMKQIMADQEAKYSLEMMTIQGRGVRKPPFPRDENHPHYTDPNPCRVMAALETNTPQYLDAINIVNRGSVTNLPADAVVDIPALVIGGDVRGIQVGNLPLVPMELCRRQITIHELVAKSAHEGDPNLFLQALCLDPYVRSITQARGIWNDYLKEYKQYLPMFKN